MNDPNDFLPLDNALFGIAVGMCLFVTVLYWNLH